MRDGCVWKDEYCYPKKGDNWSRAGKKKEYTLIPFHKHFPPYFDKSRYAFIRGKYLQI